MTPRAASLLSAVCMLCLLGCDSKGGPASALPTTRMSVGSKPYVLEIAAKEFDRQKGLMQRDAMAADHGMIFVFRDEREEGFWMKNTRIPLDIVYVNDAGRVVSVHRMEPYDESSVPSGGKIRFAIELNAGQAAEDGVKAGDAVSIPDVVRKLDADP